MSIRLARVATAVLLVSVTGALAVPVGEAQDAESATEPCIFACGFGARCAGGGTCTPRRHVGTDYDACPGQVVRAPVSGRVRRASWHTGYGGTVLIDTALADGPGVVVVAHMLCDPGCLDPASSPACNAVRLPGTPCAALIAVDQSVIAGVTPIGVVGPRHYYQNGNYSPHVHIGFRRGADDGTWRYHGYASCSESCAWECQEHQWLDPATAIACAPEDCDGAMGAAEAVDLANLGLSGQESAIASSFRSAVAETTDRDGRNAGCPVAVGTTGAAVSSRRAHALEGLLLQDYCQANADLSYSVDNESTERVEGDGLTAVLYNATVGDAFLLRSGFWGTYKCLTVGGETMGGVALLGAPSSNEYDPPGAALSRQDFQYGHMWWGPGEGCPGAAPCVHVHLNSHSDVDFAATGQCAHVVVIDNPPGPAGCEHECSFGETMCLDASRRRICSSVYDLDPCYEWSAAESCGGGFRCEGGTCTPSAGRSIQVVYPNGGERLEAGVAVQVRWRLVGTIDFLRIHLREGDRVVATLAAREPSGGAAEGTLEFIPLPEFVGRRFTVGISDSDDATVWDVSDAEFDVLAAADAGIHDSGARDAGSPDAAPLRDAGGACECVPAADGLPVCDAVDGSAFRYCTASASEPACGTWSPTMRCPLGSLCVAGTGCSMACGRLGEPCCSSGMTCESPLQCSIGSCRCPDADADGEAVIPCGGDCDDGDPDVSSRTVEVCDGLDNDCDGAIDEGTTSGGSCSVSGAAGACAIGTLECVRGATTCVGPPPATETCNATDDDCNGTTDDVSSRRLFVQLSPGVHAECTGGGWQLVYFIGGTGADAGSPVMMPRGMPIDITLPSAWACRGTIALGAYCPGLGWRDWSASTGSPAVVAGVATISLGGVELSDAEALICNYWPSCTFGRSSYWTNPRIPLDASFNGRCEAAGGTCPPSCDGDDPGDPLCVASGTGCADGSVEQVYTSSGGTMVGCNGGSGTPSQCNAAALCGPGWHLCTLTEYAARGGAATPSPVSRWIASCVRDTSGAVLGDPTDAICGDCVRRVGSFADIWRACSTSTTVRDADYPLGVVATDSLNDLVGSVGCLYAGASPSQWPEGLSSAVAGATCCR